MKKIFIFCVTLFIGVAIADTKTLNWYVGDSLYDTTTCNLGGDLTLPTAPTKYGYTFQGWKTYTPIEYLESTGTQYIDTEYHIIDVLNINFILDVSFVTFSVSSGSSFAVHGLGGSTYGGPYMGIYQNKFVAGTNTYFQSTNEASVLERYIFNLDIVNRAFHVIKVANNQTVFTLNNINNISNKTNDRPGLLLFGYTDDNSVTVKKNQSRIYSVKLYDNGTLVRDMVPVLDITGVPCMYDKVTKTCFYNAGTGDFIAGPAI